MKLSKRANLQVAAGLATASLVSMVACGGGGGSAAPAPAPTATAPVVSGQPAGQTVVAGANASFSVTATGNGTLSYQWRKNGTAVSGATSATLSLTAVTAANEGAYECVVTNSLGSSTEMAISAGATLSVNTAPAILGQPANQAAPAGAGVTFTVVADGNGTLSYQWKKAGVDIVGATSASYSIPAISAGDVASYTCVVTNTLGATTTTTTTAAATVSISAAATPVITAQPVAATIAQGGDASFSVTATGSGTLSYQWFKDGVALGGSTSSSLSLTGLVLTDAASYSCLITNSLSGASSSISTIPAALAVVGTPAISAQPAGATLVQGTNGSLSLTATANGTLSYQWQKDGVAIGGATAASLSLTGVAAGDAGSYDCVVTNTLNGVSTMATSAAAVIAVNSAASISTQPVSVTELEAGTTTLTVAATGNGTVSYQWQKNGVDVAGATGTSLVLANLAAGDAASYACVVTTTLNATSTSVTSSAALVSVNLNPAITAQPTAQGAAVGQKATFTVTATGAAGATLNYQWRKAGVDIGGATTASYQTPNLVVGDDGVTYDCLITSTLNGTTTPATTSTAVAVSAAVVPAVTIASSATNFQGGETAPTLTATVSNLGTLNGTVAYQWKKGTVAILGATASTFTLPGTVTAADAGSYTCTVTNTRNLAVGTATSTAVVLNVLSAPVLTTDLAPTKYQGGTVSPTNSTISVTASAPSGGTLSYQWQVSTDGGANWGPATGTITNASYSAPAYPTGSARMYRCQVTNTVTGLAPISILSSACTVTLFQNAAITGQPVATNVVAGTPAALTVTPAAITLAGTNQSVQWYKGFSTTVGVAIPGATSGTLNIAAADAADANYYYAIVTNSLPGATAVSSATSSIVRLGVNTAPTIVTQPASAPIATEGTAMALTTAATGAPNAALTYQWKKGGVVIAGANGASYTLSSPAAADAGSYTCDITSSMAGTAAQVVTTNAATLVVNQKPTNLPPVQTGSPATGPVTLTVTPTNPNTGSYLTYQWKRNGTSISGAIQAAYTINEITSTSAGNYTCDVASVFVATATSNASTATATSPIAAVGVGTGVTAPVVTMGSTYTAGKTGIAISCDTQVGATYEWSITNGSITAGAGTNSITVTAGTNTTLPMTATVVVNTATGGAVTTATATVVAAVTTPKLLAPASVHPGDTWMKAALDSQVGTFAWGVAGAGMITGAAPIDTLVLPFSANVGAGNGDLITLTANVQNAASDAAPTATKSVTVTTGTWLNKDGGTMWVLGSGSNTNGSAAAVFANGRILMCGGQTLSSYTPATAGIYDPATQRWTRIADMNFGRTGHTATALANGTILVTGGTSNINGLTTYLNNGEIYDPVTNTWILLTSTNMGTGRFAHTATLLTGGANVGKVAIIGGKFGSSDLATTIAIFQPSGSAGNFPGGTFSTAPVSLSLPRERHTATALNDGRVLIAGGQGLTNESYQQAEILDVTSSTTGAWSCTKVGSLTVQPRLYHSATLLLDGKVLLAAGQSSANTAELFDPATGTFTATTGTLKGGYLAVNTSGRYQHSATRLADGRVLLTGGQGGTGQGVGQSAEIFDPGTGLFTNVTPMNTGRNFHNALALSNGTVMVMGGTAPNLGTTSSTEIFDPTANAGMGSWTTVGSLNGRSLSVATRLLDGKVIVVGGQNGWQGNDTTTVPATSQAISRSTQIYDPATGNWTQSGLLATARHTHAMVVLPNGKVLVSGGTGPQTIGGSTTLASAELFDPSTNTWSSAGTMTVPRKEHGMIVLPDGKVLAIGGSQSSGPNTAACDIYDPATNLWTATGALSEPKARVVPILLSTGKVLVAGGNSLSSSSGVATVELYDPTAGTWSSLTPLSQARDSHFPFALPNGKFVLLGGRVINPAFGFWGPAGIPGGVAGALEIYDTLANGGAGATVPTANAYFKTEGRTSTSGNGVARLSDGRILLAVGTPSSTTGASTTEYYDPATDTLTVGPAQTTGHGSGALSVTLANGDVMLIGGSNTDTLTQIFRP